MKKTLLTCFSALLLSASLSAQTQFSKTTIDANTDSQPYGIASGHFTNDLYLDIAIATYNSSTVSWYKNNGDGTFATKVSLEATGAAALSYIESIAVADINNDGNDDILATSYSNSNLVWFENNGDETFQPAVLISAGLNGAGYVLTANIDNDVNGYLDVVVSEYAGNKVSYFLGNGDGTFGVKREVFAAIPSSGPGHFDIADYDDDGDLDIVVALVGTGNIKLFDNKLIQDGLDASGNVPFNAYSNNVDSGNSYLWDVIFGDINNDGKLEIIKSDSEPTVGNTAIAWFTNDPTGTGIDPDTGNDIDTNTAFTKTTITTTIDHGGAVSVADLNDDGHNDFIVSNSYASDADLIWFEGNASGTLGNEIVIDDTSPSTFSMDVKDFDNDGDLDIAGVSYLNNDLFILLNDTPLNTPDNNIAKILMYPNPTKNQLNFKGPFTGDLNVSVFDILGKNVLNAQVGVNHSLNVSKLHNGVYIIKFNDYNTTYKFIKD